MFAGSGGYFEDSSARVIDCRFEDNGYPGFGFFGGGIAVFDSDMIFQGVSVIGNVAGSWGAGMYAEGSTVFATECIFEDNAEQYVIGGGIYTNGTDLHAVSSTFRGNHSGDRGGGIHCGVSSQVLIESCLFQANSSGGDGYPGGGIDGGTSQLIVRNSAFVANTATHGSGANTANVQSALIEGCRFEENYSAPYFGYSGDGGALRGNSATTVRRSLFLGNQHIQAFDTKGAAAAHVGLLEYCTIVGNTTTPTHVPGVYASTLENCIVWGNLDTAGSPENLLDSTATYSLVQGGWPGTGNVLGDPKFWNLAGADLNLQPGSPAIDVGDPLAPFDPDGTRADAGALPFDPAYCPGCDVPLGSSYCSTAPNSTGQPAELAALGLLDPTQNLLLFHVTQLPAGQPGYLLASESQTFLPGFGGSQGALCLGSPITRFNGTVLTTNTIGSVSSQVDLNALPGQLVFVAGQTWNFQYWFRDNNPTSTSNTTQGYSILWQ